MKYSKEQWPTATNSAPSTCESCGQRMTKPFVGYELLVKPCKEFPRGLRSYSNGEWRVDCNCGITYLWRHPGIYIKTHRFLELLMYRSTITHNLIRPLSI